MILTRGGLEDELYARFVTDEERMLVRLDQERAPLPVAAFVGLTESVLGPERFYDGPIADLSTEQPILAGDPHGCGLASLPWQLPDQFHPELRHDRTAFGVPVHQRQSAHRPAAVS